MFREFIAGECQRLLLCFYFTYRLIFADVLEQLTDERTRGKL